MILVPRIVVVQKSDDSWGFVVIVVIDIVVDVITVIYIVVDIVSKDCGGPDER